MLLIWLKWNVYGHCGGSPPVAERYLETMTPRGITNDGKGLELFVPPAAVESARARLQAEGMTASTLLIGVCPSARHGNKMWLKERFAEAVARLAREHRGDIVLFGGLDERERCNDIAAMIRSQVPRVRIANLAGQLSLLETAAAMDSCALVITNDSGLMHVAAARKRKTVAVFGPTVRELGFFPYGTDHIVVETDGLDCRPCTHIGLPSCPKGHFRCMRDISTEAVVAAAGQLLTTHHTA
jgi:heptosyltransferase-2